MNYMNYMISRCGADSTLEKYSFLQDDYITYLEDGREWVVLTSLDEALNILDKCKKVDIAADGLILKKDKQGNVRIIIYDDWYE